MKKKQPRLTLKDIPRGTNRVGTRIDLQEVELKVVSGGLLEDSSTQGGTCTACDDPDC